MTFLHFVHPILTMFFKKLNMDQGSLGTTVGGVVEISDDFVVVVVAAASSD